MAEFNAALAITGLPLVAAKVQRRNQIAHMYTDALSGIRGLRFQKLHPGDTHTYKDYSVHVTAEILGITRDALAEALRQENIETKKYFYPPLHQQHLYSRFHQNDAGDLANTEYVADGILSLPIYESLADETIAAVAETLQRIVQLSCDRKVS
jgi:dTDP-4-amino-4,6-dideoxygalactose transaminase